MGLTRECSRTACRGFAVAVAGTAGGIRHKARVIDDDDGIVSDHSVQQGDPPDAPQLAAVKQRSR